MSEEMNTDSQPEVDETHETAAEEEKEQGAEASDVEGNPSLEAMLGELTSALKASNERYEKLSSEHTALLEATKKMVMSGGAVLTSEDKSAGNPKVEAAKAASLPKALSIEELAKLHFNR